MRNKDGSVIEEREYDRDHITPDQQALRIADVKFEGVCPSEKELRKLAGTEEMRDMVRALFDERKAQKLKLGQPVQTKLIMAPRLRTGKSCLDRQAMSYLEQLLGNKTHGYEVAHAALTDGGLYVPEKPGILLAPTPDEATEIVSRITPEEVEWLKRILFEAEVSLEPIGVGWQKHMENLDSGTSVRFKTYLLHDAQKKFRTSAEFNRQDRVLGIRRGGPGHIIRWNICIGEGSKERPRNHIGSLADIITKWEESKACAAGFRLPTHQSHMLAQKRSLIRASRDPYQTPGKELMDVDGTSLLERADTGRIVCPNGSATVGSDGWGVFKLHQPNYSGYDAATGHYADIRYRPQLRLRAK